MSVTLELVNNNNKNFHIRYENFTGITKTSLSFINNDVNKPDASKYNNHDIAKRFCLSWSQAKQLSILYVNRWIEI